MGYDLNEDFNYVQEQLAIIISTIGLDISGVDALTLEELMEACSSVYGPAPHSPDSPIAVEQHAELRRNQQSIRRFWYLYHVLKWRVDNE